LTEVQKYAKSLVEQSSRTKDNGDMNRKRRLQYAEKKLVRKAIETGDDTLLAKAVQTAIGKKTLPHLATALHSDDIFQQLVHNQKKLLATTGRTHRHEVGHLLVEGLPTSFLKAELGLERKDVQYIRREVKDKHKQDRYGRSANTQMLGDKNYALAVKRCKTCEDEETLLHMFYMSTTYQASGASTTRRILGSTKWEWEMALHAMYPDLLRELARQNPHGARHVPPTQQRLDQIRGKSTFSSGQRIDLTTCRKKGEGPKMEGRERQGSLSQKENYTATDRA